VVVEAKVELNGQASTSEQAEAAVAQDDAPSGQPKLRLCEMAEIEALLGRHILEDLMTGLPAADVMQAMLWIRLRRTDPAVTFEDAGEWDSDRVNTHFATAPEAPADEDAGQLDLTGVRLDTGKLRYREMAEIETHIGRRIAGDLMTGILGADLLQTMLWFTLRRTSPDITFEAVGQVDAEQVLPRLAPEELEGDAVDPPKAPSGNVTDAATPAPKSSKRSRASATSTG
jgi:hypothetical protein